MQNENLVGVDLGAARTWVALVTSVSLVVSSAAPVFAGFPQEPPAATPSESDAAPVDGGWPRTYLTPSQGKIVMYQPQVASWAEQKHVVGFSAVSYEAPKRAARVVVPVNARTPTAATGRAAVAGGAEAIAVEVADAVDSAAYCHHYE